MTKRINNEHPSIKPDEHQIQWTSEGVHSPVVVNLLGPKTESSEEVGDKIGDESDGGDDGDDGADDDDDDDDNNDDVDSLTLEENNDPAAASAFTPGDGEEEENGSIARVAAHGRKLRRTVQLGSGLPTVGSLLARLGPDGGILTKDVPPGTGYTIEVRRSRLAGR